MNRRVLLLAAGAAFIWAGCGEESSPLAPTGGKVTSSPAPSSSMHPAADPAGFACETIDFNVPGDGTGNRISTITAAGVTMDVRVQPYLDPPSAPYAMLYDTDPPIGADRDLEWDTSDPNPFLQGQCPDCEGLGEILVIEDRGGADLEGDSDGGGFIQLFNFSPAGTFRITEWKAVDDDDGPFALIVDGKEIARSSGLGNGTVEVITPSTKDFTNTALFWVGIASDFDVTPREFKRASGGFDDIRFCAQCTGQLGDFVWEDRNGNGRQDAGEPGIPNVTVLLLDASGNMLMMDETDANGFYGFSGLCAGTYTVEIDLNQPPLAGFTPTRELVGPGEDLDSNPNPFTRTYLTNNFNDQSIDFGFVLDCKECAGGLTELDLRYTGIATVSIELEGDVEFESGGIGPVVFNPGDLIQLVAATGKEKMKSEIKLYVDGDLRKIHTSCSKPIGPGAVFGVFTVEFAVSKDGGVVCPLPPCGECKGGVTRLELKYTGSDGLIEVKGEAEFLNGSTSDFVNNGDTFVLIGSKDDGKMASEIELKGPDGSTKIHTSCSQPIGPGYVFGFYEVEKAYSKDNPIEVCEVPPPPPPPPPSGGDNLCETIGKPEKLVFRYDNNVGCTFNTAQDPSKLVCDDFGFAPPLAMSVDWKAGDKDKATENDADRFGSGTATSPPAVIGDYIIADALLNGDDKLKSDTKIHLLDGGVAVRFVKMHSSCSQPIRLNDVFGGLELVGYVAEKGQGSTGIVP